MTTDLLRLKSILDDRVLEYNNPAFIGTDPICIPHRYSKLQDIEIAGFWTAILSWGLRSTIITKSTQLFTLMGSSPHEFILNHKEKDRARFESFKHRTFQPTDTLYFLAFLQHYYRKYNSLETAFSHHIDPKSPTIYDALSGFHEEFFSLEWVPDRTRKHVSTPVRGSSCKRLNMYLRWMVRRDNLGVDFGLWHGINPSILMIPLDLHVQRVAIRLGLLDRRQPDWRSVEALTAILRILDPKDPVKYDFALFSMGVLEKEKWI